MAKCRNCCKEVDPNATICPYCQTGMPASGFISAIKMILISIIGLFALGFLVYYLIATLIEPTFLLALGMTSVVISLLFFINAKRWGDFSGNINVKFNIKSGLICLVVGLALIIPSSFFVFDINF